MLPGEKLFLELGTAATGWPVYAVIRKKSLFVWNATTFVTYGTAARNLGAILGSEQGATGAFEFTLPAGITEYDDYYVTYFRRLGGAGTYAESDTLVGRGSFTLGETLLDLDAAFFRIRNAGSGGAVEYENSDGSVRFTAEPAATDGSFDGITRS